MSVSMVRAQLSTSPTSLRLELKLSISWSQAAVCLEKFVAFKCSCFASESSLFWLRYAWNRTSRKYYSQQKRGLDLRHAHVKVVHQRRGQVVGGRERLLPLDLLLLFPHLLAGLVLLH